MDKKKLYISVLDNGNGMVTKNYMMSLFHALAGAEVHVQAGSDSHPGRGRNSITAQFLESDCTDLLMVDGDIVIVQGPEAIRLIMEHDLPLVFGPYPKRQAQLALCLAPWNDNDRPPLDGGLWDVRRSGSGFCRVRRDLLESLKEEAGGPCRRYYNADRPTWDFWQSGIVEGAMSVSGKPEYLTEDWYFCENARLVGVPTLVDTRLRFKHEGICSFPVEADNRQAWEYIPGWFTTEDAECYRYIANQLQEFEFFVEVGSWMGRSMACMITLLLERDKECHLNAVDTFKGTEADGHANTVARAGGSIRSQFDLNISNFDTDSLTVIELDSVTAAVHFIDHTVKAVFIDADHSYEALRNDIIAWVAKVQLGGIMAGHDYAPEYPDVVRAVDEAFGKNNVQIFGRCWLVQL